MSLDIVVKQKKLLKKKLDIGILETICREQGLRFGVPTSLTSLEEYEGGRDIDGMTFLVYDAARIGRGFFFSLQGRTECCFSLSIPATQHDTEKMLAAVATACRALGTDTYVKDGEEVKNVADILAFAAEFQAFNASVLANSLAEEFQLIFGAVYPIMLDADFRAKAQAADEGTRMQLFEAYLDERQQHDYYYARPQIYGNGQSYIAVLVVVEANPSIVPLKPFLLPDCGIPVDTEVEWALNVVCDPGGPDQEMLHFSFEKFAEAAGLASFPRFDGFAVIVDLPREKIEQLRPFAED